MKLKTSKKDVRENYHKIISIGYCDAQFLLNYIKPFGYSAGVYGWACDYYDIDGVCICTGYSPIGNKNVKDNYALIREYDKKAQGKEANEREALLKELVNILTKG